MEGIRCNAMEQFGWGIRVGLEKVYQHLEVLFDTRQVIVAACVHHGLFKVPLRVNLRVQIAAQLALLLDLVVCGTPEIHLRCWLLGLKKQAIVYAVQILQLIPRLLVLVHFALGLLFLDQLEFFDAGVIGARYVHQAWGLRRWSSG